MAPNNQAGKAKSSLFCSVGMFDKQNGKGAGTQILIGFVSILAANHFMGCYALATKSGLGFPAQCSTADHFTGRHILGKRSSGTNPNRICVILGQKVWWGLTG